MIEHIERPEGMPPVNGYSHVVTGRGRLVAVSGQLPLDADGRLVEGDADAQAARVFVNLAQALAAVGAGPGDVLRFGYYVTDLDVLPAARRARDAFLDGRPAPASSAFRVAGLVVEGALLEIDVLAVVD